MELKDISLKLKYEIIDVRKKDNCDGCDRIIKDMQENDVAYQFYKPRGKGYISFAILCTMCFDSVDKVVSKKEKCKSCTANALVEVLDDRVSKVCLRCGTQTFRKKDITRNINERNLSKL